MEAGKGSSHPPVVTATVNWDGSAQYTPPGASQRRGGATVYELSDRLGTITHQTSPAKATLATRSYDAFGSALATTGTPVGPFGFAGGHGYQEDADSGLKLLGHRYYDPSTGRFLTRDPIMDGRNWYVYASGNPLRWLDPEGLKPGDHYKTSEDAAQDAMTDCDNASKSNKDGHEYFTVIREDGNGGYTYGDPKELGETGGRFPSDGLNSDTPIVHSHGDGKHAPGDLDHLSKEDEVTADRLGTIVYMVSPRGRRVRYKGGDRKWGDHSGKSQEWDKKRKRWKDVKR